jgi:hypothetical protein
VITTRPSRPTSATSPATAATTRSPPAWLEAAQSYEALGNLASALQLYRLAARSQDPQVARTARERISAIESLRKDAARAPAEAAPAEAADTAPAEPAPAEQKP